MSQKIWYAFGDSITDMGYYIESAAETADVKPYVFGYSGWSLGIDGNGYGTLQDAVEDMIREAQNNKGRVPDIISIFAGTNDFGHSGTVEGMKAGLENILSRLEVELPEAKILVLTPLQRNIRGGEEFGETDGLGPNKCGSYLIEYADAITEIAKTHNLPVLDLYREAPVRMERALTYTLDGLHPTSAYGEDLGRQIGEAISKILK